MEFVSAWKSMTEKTDRDLRVRHRLLSGPESSVQILILGEDSRAGRQISGPRASSDQLPAPESTVTPRRFLDQRKIVVANRHPGGPPRFLCVRENGLPGLRVGGDALVRSESRGADAARTGPSAKLYSACLARRHDPSHRDRVAPCWFSPLGLAAKRLLGIGTDPRNRCRRNCGRRH